MSHFLNRFGIGHRLIALAAIPLLVALFLASDYLLKAYEANRELTQLNLLLSITPKASNLVHELQKERGRSAGYIGSKGASTPKTALLAQRENTDKIIDSYNTLINGLTDSEILNTTQSIRSNISANLAKLDQTRTDVSNLTVTVPQMASFYTDTINKAISLVELIKHQSTNDRTSKQLATLLNIMQAKEQAGLERAMGANGFSSGKFSSALFDRFTSLITKQAQYLQEFQKEAEADVKNFYEKTVQGPALTSVQEMRDFVISSRGTIPDSKITGGFWFAEITKKIDLYKIVEDYQTKLIDTSIKAQLEASSTRLWIVAVTLFLTLLIIATIILATYKSLSVPLFAIRSAMETIAKGNTSLKISYQEFNNDIGKMAVATEAFRLNQIEREKAETAAKEAEAARLQQLQEREEEKRQATLRETEKAAAQAEEKQERLLQIEKTTEEFNRELAASINHLSESARELGNAADNLDSTTRNTESQSNKVNGLAEKTSHNMQSVASAIEELSSSISEISRQVNDSSEITRKAVVETDDAHAAMKKLSASSQAIGEMLTMINEIADQTNLLALNATIEAARAGEAGKGFTVVASEVKGLASQTAKATGEIEILIQNMQDANQNMESAVGRIGQAINETSEIVSAISGSVEQQSVATQEISNNVQQASGDTKSVTETAQSMKDDVESTKSAIELVRSSSGKISEHKDILSKIATTFAQNLKEA